MGTVRDFIFGGSKITAGGDYSHEMKRHLLLERKAMINLDSLLKSSDIILPKNSYSQSYGFSSSFSHITYRCESWTIKKAKGRRIYSFELKC